MRRFLQTLGSIVLLGAGGCVMPGRSIDYNARTGEFHAHSSWLAGDVDAEGTITDASGVVTQLRWKSTTQLDAALAAKRAEGEFIGAMVGRAVETAVGAASRPK